MEIEFRFNRMLNSFAKVDFKLELFDPTIPLTILLEFASKYLRSNSGAFIVLSCWYLFFVTIFQFLFGNMKFAAANVCVYGFCNTVYSKMNGYTGC